MRFSRSARCAAAGSATTDNARVASIRRRAGGATDPTEVFFTLDMSPIISKGLKAVASELDTSRVRFDEPLAPYTTFRIGGPADLFYETDTADDLASAVLAARRHGVPYFLLGLGANLFLAHPGFPGLAIPNPPHHPHFPKPRPPTH